METTPVAHGGDPQDRTGSPVPLLHRFFSQSPPITTNVSPQQMTFINQIHHKLSSLYIFTILF
ncbi:MAG: hypothetical protein F6K53_42630 [Moorea sp. SIO4A1]|nr:hypothetical protein [Moorena sp. SIO4A1]